MYNGSKQHLANTAKARHAALLTKRKCAYCSTELVSGGIKNHQNNCYLNPKNLKLCLNCNKVVKNWRHADTCSKRCSNYAFKRKFAITSYRVICFYTHKEECCVCGENKVVEVHHLDRDRKNNDPKNLVPLCPTHHSYMHSEYKHLIEKQVYTYLKKWSGIQDLNLGFLPSKGSGDGQTPLMPDKPKTRRVMPW
jgi:hypothetical protein